MKKILFLIPALVLAFSSLALSADTTGTLTKESSQAVSGSTASSPAAENIISVNSYPYLAALFNLGYERKLIPNMSLRARAFYWGLSINSWSIYGFGADAFFYPQGQALKGWYLGPKFDSWMMTISANGDSATGILYLLGGQAGYRWIYDGGFSMGLSLGAQKIVGSAVVTNNESYDPKLPLGDLPILPVFDFDLGFAF